MAGNLRRRYEGGWSDICNRGASVHGNRDRATGIFWGDGAQRSTRYLYPPSTGTDDWRRRRASAPIRIGVAAVDLPPAARSVKFGDFAAAHGTACATQRGRIPLTHALESARHP